MFSQHPDRYTHVCGVGSGIPLHLSQKSISYGFTGIRTDISFLDYTSLRDSHTLTINDENDFSTNPAFD